MDDYEEKLQRHIVMSTMDELDSHFLDSDHDEISISRESVTHTQTQTYTSAFKVSSTETVGGNPKHWEWEQVQKWLKSRGLQDFIPVFSAGSTQKEGTDGDELLGVTLQTLMDDAGAYQAGQKLDIPTIEDAENDGRIIRFLKELTKLQLKANESVAGEFGEKEAIIDDVIEIKRRIQQFIEKWDKILWIEGYEDTNDKLPTDTIISEELGVSMAVAQVYLHYYKNVDRMKTKEVNELLLDFNVYNDCVIWWFIIVTILGNQSTKSIWLLFNKVAELTPGNCAIQLLDKYKFDLTRFNADHLEQSMNMIFVL